MENTHKMILLSEQMHREAKRLNNELSLGIEYLQCTTPDDNPQMHRTAYIMLGEAVWRFLQFNAMRDHEENFPIR